MEYSKLFTDNSIIVKGLTKILDEESITYLVKDRVESSRLLGLGPQIIQLKYTCIHQI